MIRINLIPVKEKKKRQELFIIACVVAGLVLLVLGMIWFYGLRLQAKADLKIKIQQVDEESKSYEEKIKEVKDLETNEASLDGIRKTLKTITDSQRKAISALDLIGAKLPDGVWLTGVTQGKDKDDNVFTLQGYAFSNSNLEDFFNAFQKPGSSFKESTLDLLSINAMAGLTVPFISFKLLPNWRIFLMKFTRPYQWIILGVGGFFGIVFGYYQLMLKPINVQIVQLQSNLDQKKKDLDEAKKIVSKYVEFKKERRFGSKGIGVASKPNPESGR